MKRVIGQGRRVFVYHEYYRRSGFYKFLLSNSIKLVSIILVLVAAFIAIDSFLPHLKTDFTNFLYACSPRVVIGIFFTSEIFLGLIPPDLFIIWSYKTAEPTLILSLLAVLSYLGGFIAFQIGRFLWRFEKIRAQFIQRIEKNVDLVKKWGGFLIVISALLPLPFSTVSLAAGLLKYPQKYYIFLGLFRIPRIFLYSYFFTQFI